MLKKLRPSLPKKKVLLILFSLLLHSLLFSQEKITVKGTVVIENNVRLAGVSVNVKGNPTGTVTDEEGNFTLQVSKGATLVLSYVGYRQKEVEVTGKGTLSIQMISTNASLSEVVVVSYGTQKKRDLTGAISQMNAAEVKDMPVENIGQKLQGKFAGVQVGENDGTPGVEMTFRIRGAASINAGNSPLIVIDGFPTESGLGTLSP